MRPTILRIDSTPQGFAIRREEGLLLTLRRDVPAHRPVVKSLDALADTSGSRFFVLALVSPNDEGGHDIVPTFVRAIKPEEEPDW